MEAYIAQLSSFLSAYGSWVGLASLTVYMLFTRKKRLAEITEIEVRTAIELINELKKKVEDLSGEIRDLRASLEEKERMIEAISRQCPQCPLKNMKQKAVFDSSHLTKPL